MYGRKKSSKKNQFPYLPQIQTDDWLHSEEISMQSQ